MLNRVLAAYAAFGSATGTWLMMDTSIPWGWKFAGVVINGSAVGAAAFVNVKPPPEEKAQ